MAEQSQRSQLPAALGAGHPRGPALEITCSPAHQDWRGNRCTLNLVLLSLSPLSLGSVTSRLCAAPARPQALGVAYELRVCSRSLSCRLLFFSAKALVGRGGGGIVTWPPLVLQGGPVSALAHTVASSTPPSLGICWASCPCHPWPLCRARSAGTSKPLRAARPRCSWILEFSLAGSARDGQPLWWAPDWRGPPTSHA